MTRRSRRPRYLVLILALAALVTAIAAPGAAASDPVRTGGRILPHVGPERTPALFVVPNGTLGFKSYTGWVYDDDSIAVVGEVQNNTTTRRKTVSIRVTWFTSDQPGATSLGSVTASASIDSVARGNVGPFEIFDETPPAGTGAFQVEILSSQTTTTPAAGGLNITPGTSYVDDQGTPDTSDDLRMYPGTIGNPNSFAVTDIQATLTAYATAVAPHTAAGDVLEVWSVSVGDIPARGSAPFEIGISSQYTMGNPAVVIPIQRVAFVADGFRSGQSTYVTSWANYFDDLLGSSFRDDIAWLAQEAITYGCGPGKYCPDANVRRDEMASFLARSVGLTGSAPNVFTDDEGNTHEANINRIAAAGITTGCGSGLYCPATTVRRDAMASFLARSVGLTGSAPNAFNDDNGNTHEANINLVAQAGITTGCGPSKFCPTGLVTRGQMAAFLRRAFE